MKRYGTCAIRLAIGLFGLAALAGSDAAPADTTGPPDAAAPPFWHVPGTTAAAVYQDQYLSGGDATAPDISKGFDESDDAGGLSRSLQIDGVTSAITSHDGGSST